jgi:hypothetical protein
MRYLYVILAFVLCSGGLYAAVPPANSPKHKAVLRIDSSRVNVRNFDKAALQAYSKQPEFKYGDISSEPSAWTRFWRWFWHLFDFSKLKIQPSDSFLQLVLKFFEYLFILLGLGAIIFLILRLVGIDMLNIFRRKSKTADLSYSESIENIHEINFDADIERSIANRNYRLAVRLLYLKCLKQLSDASLIKWQPEKTNSAYIDELTDAAQQFNFKMLTRQFEYVWYGEFTIDDKIYSDINRSFQEFRNSMA